MSTAPLLDRDAFVGALVRQGVPRERAEAQYERTYGRPAPAITLEEEDVLEKAEQCEVVKLYRAFGCQVYSTSQARRSKVSAGIPDLIVFHRVARAHWYHEVKRQQGGRIDPAQVVFRELCLATNADHVVGDRFAAGEQLVRLGIAVKRDDGGLEPAYLGGEPNGSHHG